jgi:transcriptional regulator
MYLRAVHADLHMPTLRQFIRNNPLGILTTAISSENFPLLQCSHIPWVLDVVDDESEDELGVLRGHMARANPHSKAIIEHCTSPEAKADSSLPKIEKEVMILFNGPAQHYITPKFYTTTKPATGKVVPTWNYSAVQVYGTATVFIDPAAPETIDYLTKQVDDLTRYAEAEVMQHSSPWNVSDAPDSYVELMKKAIIGIEVVVHRLEGKFKMSQEMGQGDREGIVEGLEGLGTEIASEVARTVKERGDMKDKAKESKGTKP